ncbi:hypothetical protein K488DRAFT_55070 [Vararia minispora EC-137]|uniref:Uncharacterized protein n=1 Tax=Vararia minispora EC-137 TaxID=1314806 RepID=A0ACB8QED9_9AGAM|nr:hypothetical protein K488DRAFT_55070 [Vararia minispora EC-137]
MATSDVHRDPYAILGLSGTSLLTQAALKIAYHQALLRHHPDKSKSPPSSAVSLDILRSAYETLSCAPSRAAHDQNSKETAPRPADVVSLDELEEHDDAWTLGCRCGGSYRISVEQLENDVHLVGCGGCSEVVWVGYEAVDEG